ncbi:MAG: aminofutalosine synthase MqnE [Nitrospinae bacterium]|nr:aminofutalosine synthase MqnE [Nitrospinota bacterium]
MLIHPSLEPIREKVEKGERLSFQDGLDLFRSPDLLGVGALANIVRERKNGNRAYFIVNRHINPTNICKNRCRFCAFSKNAGEEGAYAMDLEAVLKSAATGPNAGPSEFHIVGGLHPEWPFHFYEEMLRALRDRFPNVHLKAFTAVEIAHLAEVSGLGIEGTLLRLKEAGLGSLPGGGAEIFNPATRNKLCPEKITGGKWLEVMETAHGLGIPSTATMLYGHIESAEDRVDHLIRLRELQDRTNGFLSFIPLAFHPKNTDFHCLSASTGQLDLKVMAVSRLMLDNFAHIKAYWIMLGPKISQISLMFGADDMDGTVVEEKITHAAGAETAQFTARETFINLISGTGRDPYERDALYRRMDKV